MSAAGQSGAAAVSLTAAGSVVLAQAAGALVAFDVAEVVEIVAVPALTRVPLAHPDVKGVANVRGRVLPVVDLGALLGRPHPSPPALGRLVVVKSPQGMLGVLVDCAFDVTTLDSWREATDVTHASDARSRRILLHPDGRSMALIDPSLVMPCADATVETV